MLCEGLLRRMALDVTPLRTSRDYRLLFAASGVSGFGSFITYVTIPFQVYALTDDPLLVGLLGVCELVPLLFMAFVGGALADYLDRRALVLGAEVAFTALCGVLLVNALLDRPHLWLLYLVAGLTAAIDGIQRPALEGSRRASSSPTRSRRPARSTGCGCRSPSSPPRARRGADRLDRHGLGVRGRPRHVRVLAGVPVADQGGATPPDAERPSLRSVVTGLRYARSRPELLGTYLVDINAMFFAMPQALYPFMAGRLGGPAVLGLLYAAPAVGSLLATVTSGWTGRVHRHGLMVVIAAGLWGVGIIGFGLANSLWLALLCLAFAGAADMVSGIFRMTIWNQTIPDHLRGRLAGIEMISWATGPLLGQLRSGVAARYMGIGGSVISGGILCVAGTLALAAAMPAFLRYDGRDGAAKKKTADEEWAARASTSVA
ncbi:MFS transporter [Phytohabitans flavus]|uniref:MFS transporter n=1 Tax=Phytohabitans flavus TaxID=1076124 RepID=UPI003625E3DD